MEDKTLLNLICKECESPFTISMGSFRKIQNGNLCKPCRKKYYNNKLSEINKKKRSERSLQQWKNMSDEEKADRSLKIHQKLKANWSNLSIADRNERIKLLQINFQKFLENLSEEDKDNINNKRSIAHKKIFEELSSNEKNIKIELLRDSHRKYLDNITEDQKFEAYTKLSKSLKKYYDSLSDDEKKEYIRKMQIGWKNWYKNLSDQDRLKWTSKLSKSNKEYWNYMIENNWMEWQIKNAIGIFIKRNDISYIPSSLPNLQFECFLQKYGILFYREYPSIVITNPNSNKWYIANKDNDEVSQYILLSSKENNISAFRKSWDYLIYIPFTNNRIYIDIDGDMHNIEYKINEDFKKSSYGEYINAKFDTNNISDIISYYDNRRDNIECNKFILRASKGKLSQEELNGLLIKILNMDPQ